MDHSIELVSISNLLDDGRVYKIPDYQRGYRWRKEDVQLFLDDIWETQDDRENCIQPLIVARVNDEEHEWNVVDGQQRLTTIMMLCEELYCGDIKKEPNTKLKLKSKSESDVDKYYKDEARGAIKAWLAKLSREEDKRKFEEKLLKRTFFILYQIDAEQEHATFRRMNVAKIPLTDAELIKALLLNESNFRHDNQRDIKTNQRRIASEWDRIEIWLRNAKNWLFFHSPKEKCYEISRIDFILEILVHRYPEYNQFENHPHSVYLSISSTLKGSGCNAVKYTSAAFELWKRITRLFYTMQEWVEDPNIYHYLGYIFANEMRAEKLVQLCAYYIKLWDECSRPDFIEKIKMEIKRGIESVRVEKEQGDWVDGIRALSYGDKAVRNVLLMHNIFTILTRIGKENVFMHNDYFPFHLYKLESWDVEHITSSTDNDFNDDTNRAVMLQSITWSDDVCHRASEEIQKGKGDEDAAKRMEAFWNWIRDFFESNSLNKDSIANLALLNSSINRAYKNGVYPYKKAYIQGKLNGKKLLLAKEKYDSLIKNIRDGVPASELASLVADIIRWEDSHGQSVFIPPCTLQVFQKFYYSGAHPQQWSEQDAKAYLDDIIEKIKLYLF